MAAAALMAGQLEWSGASPRGRSRRGPAWRCAVYQWLYRQLERRGFRRTARRHRHFTERSGSVLHPQKRRRPIGNRRSQIERHPPCPPLTKGGRRSPTAVALLPFNPQSTIRNPQSAIRNPQSTIRNRQSAIGNPQSTIRNPQSTIRNPQSTIRNPQSAIRNPQSAIGNRRGLRPTRPWRPCGPSWAPPSPARPWSDPRPGELCGPVP